jgi:hypothetical protein
MSTRWLLLSLLLSLATPAASLSQETLRYTVNWPSGLSLGEGQLTSSKTTTGGWDVNFQVEAALPGFAVSEQVRSAMSGDFCSAELEKNATRGRRKANETTVFEKGKATRTTARGGGKSEISISDCGRDVLAFLQFARKELGQGRVPAPSTVLYGAPYRIRMDFVGTQTVKINEQPTTTDKLNVSVKGPQADLTFEAFFARDAVRTPVLFRIPSPLGAFSLELVK